MLYKSKQRPGVFSSYTVSGKNGGRTSEQAVGLVSTAVAGECGKVYKFTRLSALLEVFGNSGNMLDMAEILFSGGVSKIYCVGIDTQSGDINRLYAEAFELLELFEDIGAVVCDSGNIEVHELLKESVGRSSQMLKERIGFCSTDMDKSITEAKQMDFERICVATPEVSYKGQKGYFLAAVYAALALSSADPAQNLNMSEFFADIALETKPTDQEIDELVENGVAIFEPINKGVRLIRAVTTKVGGQSNNYGFGELSTVRIVDYVMASIRNMLKVRLKGAKNSQSTLEAIRTQTALQLEEMLDSEIISSYDPPTAFVSEEDTTICVVEISFSVMHIMHQIHLMAYITV